VHKFNTTLLVKENLIGMDWQVVEWVMNEWCSEWVKSDKCKVYLLYCIDISGECPFVFVKIGMSQKQPVSVSKHSCTHSCCLSPPLLLFLTGYGSTSSLSALGLFSVINRSPLCALLHVQCYTCWVSFKQA
jgi:hypothetical protein